MTVEGEDEVSVCGEVVERSVGVFRGRASGRYGVSMTDFQCPLVIRQLALCESAALGSSSPGRLMVVS